MVNKRRVEILRLSKPYPFIKFVRDGRDYVFSFLSFYVRIKADRQK